jgi:hypothetical protein
MRKIAAAEQIDKSARVDYVHQILFSVDDRDGLKFVNAS